MIKLQMNYRPSTRWVDSLCSNLRWIRSEEDAPMPMPRALFACFVIFFAVGAFIMYHEESSNDDE
eukprot:scaffold7698_cov186-Alexandrium_tamarense.AAC.11